MLYVKNVRKIIELNSYISRFFLFRFLFFSWNFQCFRAFSFFVSIIHFFFFVHRNTPIRQTPFAYNPARIPYTLFILLSCCIFYHYISIFIIILLFTKSCSLNVNIFNNIATVIITLFLSDHSLRDSPLLFPLSPFFFFYYYYFILFYFIFIRIAYSTLKHWEIRNRGSEKRWIRNEIYYFFSFFFNNSSISESNRIQLEIFSPIVKFEAIWNFIDLCMYILSRAFF